MSAGSKWAPLLVLAIAGCGTEPSPEVAAGSAARQALIFFPGYTASSLPLTPQGMNDSGAMAGTTPSGAPALYNGGTLTPLGTTPSDGCYRYLGLRPTSSNGVVGNCITTAGSRPVFWFFLSWGPAHAPMQLSYSAASSATVNGTTPGYSMVGGASGPNFPFGQAFRWTGPGAATLTPIQPVSVGGPWNWSTSSTAVSMNDAGYAVGWVNTITGTFPVVWNPSNGVTGLQTFGTDSYYRTRPTVVNNGGYIAGMSGTSSATGFYAMLWRLDGTLANYVPIASLASVDGLSANGRLVGKAYTGSGYRAWTWYNGSLAWLDPPAGASYLQPVGVDSCGRIAAQAVGAGGVATGVLLSKLFCDTGVVAAFP
jgi:hypothetical protein